MTSSTPTSSDNYQPGLLREIESRKDAFDKLLKFVTSRHGWIISVPGSSEIAMECLPGSALPEELYDAGYDPEPAGVGERILPHAIRETFLTEGSTVVRRVTHAGIVRVERFTFPS
jgi:hypothetical protein